MHYNLICASTIELYSRFQEVQEVCSKLGLLFRAENMICMNRKQLSFGVLYKKTGLQAFTQRMTLEAFCTSASLTAL